jgi:oligoribonuclease (3'-5' exoribonuclease)
MTIEEFRKGHYTNDKTFILNLPPMISTNFSYEVVNTSYLKNITDNMHIKLDNQNIKKGKTVNTNTIDNKLSLIVSK